MSTKKEDLAAEMWDAFIARLNEVKPLGKDEEHQSPKPEPQETKTNPIPLEWPLPCPFCGHIPHVQNFEDSLHPIGKEPDSLWTFSCLDNEGGCNARILGKDPVDCITKWNRRIPPPTSFPEAEIQ